MKITLCCQILLTAVALPLVAQVQTEAPPLVPGAKR
jgi:hypothetical protein